MQITHLPLASIDPAALPRDRSAPDPAAQDTLTRSILAEGLRMAIEVFPLHPAFPGAPDFGLISGFRRYAAFQTLAASFPDRFSSIPVLIRQPGDLPTALAAMVTENELRTQITPWEKASLLLECVAQGIFPAPDDAIAGLFPYADRNTRHRLRSMVLVVEELGPLLSDPQAYTQAQLLRIAAAIKAGYGEVIEVALHQHTDTAQPAQWSLMQNILAEAERSLADPTFLPAPPRKARHTARIRSGLMIRREMLPNGWRLVFTGEEANGMLMDSIISEIERLVGR